VQCARGNIQTAKGSSRNDDLGGHRKVAHQGTPVLPLPLGSAGGSPHHAMRLCRIVAKRLRARAATIPLDRPPLLQAKASSSATVGKIICDRGSGTDTPLPLQARVCPRAHTSTLQSVPCRRWATANRLITRASVVLPATVCPQHRHPRASDTHDYPRKTTSRPSIRRSTFSREQ